jgi:hypothetical protein
MVIDEGQRAATGRGPDERCGVGFDGIAARGIFGVVVGGGTYLCIALSEDVKRAEQSSKVVPYDRCTFSTLYLI